MIKIIMCSRLPTTKWYDFFDQYISVFKFQIVNFKLFTTILHSFYYLVTNSMKYLCNVCHKFSYELEKGDPAHGIPPNTKPEDLPDDRHCPICHNDKTHLKAVED